jgi:DNA-binding response OmpR family regulator
LHLSELLKGLRILVLEDEFLIAMDVEQLCRDHGASDVEIRTTLDDLNEGDAPKGFDAAIVDVMLGGVSTLSFAQRLVELDVPFVFSTGYADDQEIVRMFPGVAVVGKPYSGDVLVSAVAAACRRPGDRAGSP